MIGERQFVCLLGMAGILRILGNDPALVEKGLEVFRPYELGGSLYCLSYKAN